MQTDAKDDAVVPEWLPKWVRVVAYVLMAAYYGGRLVLFEAE